MNEPLIPSLSEVIGSIIASNNASAASIEVTINLNGTTRTFVGKKAVMMDLSIPMVTLLAPESTPQNQTLSPTAVKEFEAHAQELCTGNKQFSTVLRPGWNLPTFLWSEKYVHADVACHKCRKLGATCVTTRGGKMMTMKCIHCGFVFSIDGE